MLVPEDLVAAMHRALTELGYPLCLDDVRVEAARLTDDNEKAVSGPSMFIAGSLHKAGLRSTER